MAQNADDIISSPDGDISTNVILGGVGGLLLVLLFLCAGFFIIMSLLANQNFMEIMFAGATPVPTQ